MDMPAQTLDMLRRFIVNAPYTDMAQVSPLSGKAPEPCPGTSSSGLSTGAVIGVSLASALVGALVVVIAYRVLPNRDSDSAGRPLLP
jgi:hypothetical protein